MGYPSNIRTCYRIGLAQFRLLDGAGAAAQGARWNDRGRFIIYAAEHYATAVLEVAAQLNSVRIPRTLAFVEIVLPHDASIEDCNVEDVTAWNADDKRASRAFGDRWYDEERSLVLFVPSLVAPGLERNVLINQRHPQFARVRSSKAQTVRCHPRLLL